MNSIPSLNATIGLHPLGLATIRGGPCEYTWWSRRALPVWPSRRTEAASSSVLIISLDAGRRGGNFGSGAERCGRLTRERHAALVTGHGADSRTLTSQQHVSQFYPLNVSFRQRCRKLTVETEADMITIQVGHKPL
jgi:hypothetical protein